MDRTSDPLIPLVVDDRECRSPLPAALEATGAFDISIERLNVGDYRVANRLLMERKTLPDLVLSIKSGRLFSQSLRLVETPAVVPVLLLEGTSDDLADSAMRWECIQGALVSLSIFAGLSILRTRNPQESARTILFAAQQLQSIETESLPRRGYRPKGKAALQRYILQGLPGIGPAKARRLLDRFGSIRRVVGAEPDELHQVEGIGKTIAEKIDWAVRDSGAVVYDASSVYTSGAGTCGRTS